MSLTGLAAIAFDLDDTLTDWWTGIERAATAVGDPEICERVRATTWVERNGVVVNRHHWRVELEPEKFMGGELVEAFLEALDPPLFADVSPALESLHGRVRLALLTNNPFGMAVLERHGLHSEIFDCVVVADPSWRKPDPRAFGALVDALGDPPERVAYVGDSVIADVEGSLAVGLRAVWLDRWNDEWRPPTNVTRVTSLIELSERC
jgi:HAD superfamily hydrolase (TIGR01549 family)